MSAVSKQNSFLCGPLCMRVCLHGSNECSIVHVSGWVCVCLQMRDSESPGSGVINSSWRLGSVKLGDRLSLFLILFLPGPLTGGPLIGSENDRDRELWPAVSGQMPLTHCSQLAIIHHLDFTKCQQKCPLSQHEFLFAIHLTVIWCYSEWSWIFIENKWREGLDFIQWESIEW